MVYWWTDMGSAEQIEVAPSFSAETTYLIYAPAIMNCLAPSSKCASEASGNSDYGRDDGHFKMITILRTY